MKVVQKHMPLACLQAMDPADLVGVFKEAGFTLASDECPIQLKAPWLQYKHRDGSFTYVQFHGPELESNPILGLAGGRL